MRLSSCAARSFGQPEGGDVGSDLRACQALFVPAPSSNPNSHLSFNNHQSLQQVVDSDGWFHTGDIGTLTSSGALKIIDRKKNIFKLSQVRAIWL
jgi:acyl-CoA synthetase (AMP-forming)/AMP-acid ligase II